ncbi:MAG: methyltransferase [Pirellulaceae bacterium]
MHSTRHLSWNAVAILAVSILLTALSGCPRPIREDLSYDYGVEQTWQVEELSGPPMVQFESVFWEPDDTLELRRLITEEGIAQGRDCLEIGTGTGLISILCLAHGANRVVATDINPAAVACARYNAAQYELDENFEVRQVDPAVPEAFAVIKPNERFDLILSNPPWEDGEITKPADYAFYDPGFQLLESIVVGLPEHLKPGGRCLLSYGSVAGVEKLRTLAEEHGLQFEILDDRDLETLEPVFLPGMLVELRVKPAKVSTHTEAK